MHCLFGPSRCGLISRSLVGLYALVLIGCAVPLEEENGASTPTDEIPAEQVEQAVSPPVQSAVSQPRKPFIPPPLTDASREAQKDFTFGYWQNGWRKQADDASPDIFCIETGHYGFTLDINHFAKAQFGIFNDALGYEEALAKNLDRMASIDTAKFKLAVTIGDEEYRAVSCKAGRETGAKHLQYARLWESGRLVQHFDFLELILENDQGKQLACHGKLNVVAWPDSLTFSAEVTPGEHYRDGHHAGVNGNGVCVVNTPVELPHQESMEREQFSLEAWVKVPLEFKENNKGILVGKNGDTSSKGFFGFTIDEGQVAAVVNTVGGRNMGMTLKAGGFKIGEWNHLALTYDGREMRFYINGVPRGKRSHAEPRPLGRGKMTLGGGPHKHSPVARGVYDQVLVWDRVLSEDEVEVHAYDAHKMKNRKGLVFTEFFKSKERLRDVDVVWENAQLSLELNGGGKNWKVEQPLMPTWPEGETKKVVLDCDLRKQPMPLEGLALKLDPEHGELVTATFDQAKGCYIAEIDDLKRPWKGGYTDIRDYDEFSITVDNPSADAQRVPLLIYLRDVANITGVVPMLCDEEGKPTGVPVQLSKNWHYQPYGSYLCSYMMLPAKAGQSTYTFRVAYGFYGKLPSASHAQLSLVGYGGNGRWDQLAIGCWGETICFDMDMSCVDVTVTDVRLLMARAGIDGRKWNWTDAGWGGDWLNALDEKGQKLYPNEVKTAYLSHGPCLTEVKYDGKYGRNREIDWATTVRTLRTDDYARTFFALHYQAIKEAQLEKGWLFKMGRTGSAITPRIAYGNKEGLLEEKTVPALSVAGEKILDQVTLMGEGPWWVTFPGGTQLNSRGRAVGTRALIIRSYEAKFNGVVYKQPTLSAPVYRIHQGGEPNLDALLVPPKGVDSFTAGDEVKMDIEWMTLPTVADHYYGPNESFRAALVKDPNSWEAVYREVDGNDLSVEVKGGELLNTYPVIIKATSKEVVVSIQGGVGAVPIRFEGLEKAAGYTLYHEREGGLHELDQGVHGHDFWQNEYDAKSNSWMRSYNLLLDGLSKSTWHLISD